MKQNFSRARLQIFVALLLVAAVAISLPIYQNSSVSAAGGSQQAGRPRLTRFNSAGVFVRYQSDHGMGCRTATEEEVRIFSERNPNERLRPIASIQTLSDEQQTDGLQIVLRGTDQLMGFPDAKNTFLRAAELWKARIQTPVTIVVDVDFGPKRFGETYPARVLGSTDTQSIGGEGTYQDVRTGLLTQNPTTQELGIYNALPQGSIPTDMGQIDFMIGPSSVFRALGLIDPVANPDLEEPDFGDPPSIGFNSAFAYDFDPSNGIDANKIDFEAVAVHELGHALGFESMVGLKEFSSRNPDATSVWDLFRFKPGTTIDTFSSAPRVLSLGGSHNEFAAGLEVAQSTGGVDGSGGDGEQSSHWKDDSLNNGLYIGVMDPVIAFGERNVITSHDLAALDLFGYRLRDNINVAPEAGNFLAVGSVPNGTLTITGAVMDPDRDVTQARVQLFNSSGQLVRDVSQTVTSGNFNISTFTLQITNLDQLASLQRASITLVDGQNQVSQALSAGLLLDGASTRPVINSISYNGKKLIIKGTGLAGQDRLEINGAIVSEKNNGSGKKLKVAGNVAAFNVRAGANSVRVINGNLRSDAANLNF